MGVGIADEHEELRRSVRGWIEVKCPPSAVRDALDAGTDSLPSFWPELAEQGYLAVHVPEEFGGQGAGLLELAVVVEELGRAAAPGPWAGSALVAAVLAELDASSAKELLPALADGSLTAAVVVPAAGDDGADAATDGLVAVEGGDGSVTVTGTLRPVPSGEVVDVVLTRVGTGDGARWVVLAAGDADIEPLPSFDPSRRLAAWTLDAAAVPAERVLDGARTSRIRDLAVTLAAAEAAGGARWCLDTAAEHARTREQFGRPIGQFQGIKHKLADVLVAVEQSVAAAWDAAQLHDLGPAADPGHAELAAAVAGSLAVDGYVEAAKATIQVLGGMGFTWEHDAHIHLRRAVSIRQLLGGTPALRAQAARLALAGTRRRLTVDLPPEGERLLGELRPVVEDIAAETDPAAQRRRLADAGLLAPHWPRPWGRDAGPVEQLVIDRVCAEAGLRRPTLAVAAWALPTIMAHGTSRQTERWVGPTLRGELTWCQLFSEPGAGSDLASLSTRATRVDGGWSLTGQKVWTSVATHADLGICLARTNPDAPKHAGITYFVVDMRAAGIEVRPLRELTGDELFNEVFFDGCVVPDDCVIGEVDGGWRLARTTLANERVSLSSDSAFGGALEALLAWLAGHPDACDPVTFDRLGALLAEAQSLALLGLRVTLRSMGGLQPGPESSVRKLLGAEYEQRINEFGLEVLGPAGACRDGDAARWTYAVLQSRCMTIAGGTSEVQRNVIGERLLGLPRDPEPGR